MLKFAFIINMPGQNHKTYSGVYENSESYNLIAGTDNMEEANQFVEELVGQGFTLFNLCGDFDDDMTNELQKIAGDGVKILHSDYTPEEMEKMESLKSMEQYGIIIKMAGVEKIEEVQLKCDDCTTTALFVKDEEQAEAAAKEMASRKMDFIELCSWFDREKTEAIISAVDGKIPVGTCGEL